MKNLFLATAFFLFAEITSAQNNGYIVVGIGSGIPIGDFGSLNSENGYVGMATSGALYEISMATKLTNHVGFVAIVRTQKNPFDNTYYKSIIESTSNPVNWDVQSDPWSMQSYMLGIFGTIPIAKSKISFNLQSLIGYFSIKSPEVTVKNQNIGGGYWDLYERTYSDQGSSVGYLLGASLKFDVTKRLCVFLSMDYTKSKPEFDNVKVIDSWGYVSYISYIQVVEHLNNSLCFGIRF